jgi:hypothetical protein
MESKTNVIPLCHQQVVALLISLWRKCGSEALVDNCISAIIDAMPLCVLLANLAAHLNEVSLYKPEMALQR